MAAALLGLAELYLWIGLAVAAAFVLLGVDRVDPAARGAYAFRLLLIPGAALLWPLVLLRWAAIEFARTDRRDAGRP